MKEDDPASKIKQLMRESAPAPHNVIDLAAAARTRGRSLTPRKQLSSQSVNIHGNNSTGVIGNNNSVHINIRGSARPTIQVIPGEDEIDNEQAAEIKRLVGKVVEASGRSYPHVYSTLYRRFQASSYLLIKRHRYDDAVRYLHKWIASSSTPVPAGDAESQRKQFLKRIHAQARKTRGTLDRIRAFALGRFGTQSLADLQPSQLQEVIRQFRL